MVCGKFKTLKYGTDRDWRSSRSVHEKLAFCYLAVKQLLIVLGTQNTAALLHVLRPLLRVTQSWTFANLQ